MTDPMRGRLHHVELYVNDLERSEVFWGWLLGALGYDEYQRWPLGVSYRLGPTYLVLVQVDSAYLDPPYHRRRAGLNHLAFHAGPRAEVDRLTRELETRGVPILYRDRHPHAGGPESYAVFCEDPDRIKVELIASEAT